MGVGVGVGLGETEGEGWGVGSGVGDGDGVGVGPGLGNGEGVGDGEGVEILRTAGVDCSPLAEASICVVPGEMALTKPLLSTVAKAESFDCHVKITPVSS